jgi:hypothetical protein
MVDLTVAKGRDKDEMKSEITCRASRVINT